MIEDFESEMLGGLVLQRFNGGIVKLDRFFALHADHMVVVLMIVEMLIPRDAVSEVDFTREPAVGQNLHRPIDCGISDARIMMSDGPIYILHASMAFIVEENIKNQLTVRRQFKLPALQVFHEYLHFRRKDFHTVKVLAVSGAAA
jgi:hypothetical protein